MQQCTREAKFRSTSASANKPSMLLFESETGKPLAVVLPNCNHHARGAANIAPGKPASNTSPTVLPMNRM
jgi:hypothetical protein